MCCAYEMAILPTESRTTINEAHYHVQCASRTTSAVAVKRVEGAA